MLYGGNSRCLFLKISQYVNTLWTDCVQFSFKTCRYVYYPLDCYGLNTPDVRCYTYVMRCCFWVMARIIPVWWDPFHVFTLLETRLKLTYFPYNMIYVLTTEGGMFKQHVRLPAKYDCIWNSSMVTSDWFMWDFTDVENLMHLRHNILVTDWVYCVNA